MMYIMHCACNVSIQCMFINACIVYVKQLCACYVTNCMLHVLVHVLSKIRCMLHVNCMHDMHYAWYM